MKTRTPKKEGSTPPVKKAGDKTGVKTGASPAQSKASLVDPAPSLKIGEEAKLEIDMGDSEAKSVKATADEAEAKLEVKGNVAVAAVSSKEVNGDRGNEGSAAGRAKKSNEPGVAVAKPKMKTVTPKKRKIAGLPPQVKSSASEPIQPANEVNAGEKQVKTDKPIEKHGAVVATESPKMVTKVAALKQKGPLKGLKPAMKGKGTVKVKKVLKQDKQSTKDAENELPTSKVVTFEERLEAEVPVAKETEQCIETLEMAGEKDTEGEEGDDDEGMELVDEDCELELEEEGDENVEEGFEADELEPRPATERQKRKKLEVFVGGLDKDATEGDLKSVFQKVGDVVEVRLVMNPLTGKNKGYAFIRFGTTEQATRAITELARTQVRGKECGVLPNQDNDTLFLGNISRDWKREQVLEKVKQYGIDGIEELTLMEDPQNERLNRGFAFLELATHNDALKAFQRLQQPDAIFGTDRSAKVAWAQPLNDPDDAVMSQVKSIFVDGMPANWSDDKVKQHFGKFGEIERIVFARNMPVAKRKDFAFVNFVARESALACVSAFKGVDLIDGDNKVKMKITLARPLPKGRFGKPGARGGYLLGQGGRGAGRGEDWFYSPRFSFRRPFRGGRAFSWGGGRMMGRYGGKRPYIEEDVHSFPRAPRQQDDWNANYRGRRPSGGGFPRMSRGFMRGGYSRNDHNRYYESRQSDIRREEPRRNAVGFAPGEYHKPGFDRGASRGRFSHPGPLKVEHVPHRPLRGVSSARSRATHSGRRVSPRHEDVHPHQYESSHVYGHERDVFDSRVQDYDESGLGVKRPFSGWDDDSSYYDPGHRGYPRARIDYTEPSTLPDDGSRYLDSVRPPPGRSNQVLGLRPERPAPSSVGDGPVSSFYDSGTGLGTAGNNALHGTHGYGSMLPETNEYISAAPEMRGTSLHPSSLYGDHSGSGVYDFQGPGYY